MIKKIITYTKKHGVANTLRKAILKWLRIDKQQDQIDTLHFFFNKFHDVTDIKEIDNPDLRILQKCNAIVLAIFDKLCSKYELSYWLDYGTLLGAIRHNATVPWDDDTDICMKREDMEKVILLLKEELNKFGINIEAETLNPMYRIGLSYLHKQTGIWVDVYPVDIFSIKDCTQETLTKLQTQTEKYRYYYLTHTSDNPEKLKAKKQEIMGEVPSGNCKYTIRVMESPYYVKYMPYTKVFPLKKHLFEGFELNVPADCDSYLKDLYGNYYSFPKGGILHHGSDDKFMIPIYKWAEHSGIDMAIVYKHLYDCYSMINKI